MKAIFNKNKIVVLTLVCMLFGMFFIGSQDSEAKAETTYQLVTDDTDTDFAYVQVSANDVIQNLGSVPEFNVSDDYLFAGWFKTKACTSADAIKTSADVNGNDTYYAKYVSEKVLSIYAQLSDVAGTDSEGNTTRNIRFVSSVDSLTYQKVGFKLEFGSTTKYNHSTNVFEEIDSSTSGDEFTFSPKIIDTDSEYFITAKWMDVPETDTTGFYVRAYYKTMDGVVAYGPSRYVTIEDGLSTNVVVVPVKGTVSGNPTVTYNNNGSNATASAVEIISTDNKDSDDSYTHLRITLAGNKSSLDSVTTFAISGTTLTEQYRYVNKTNDGTADTTWFTQYSGKSEFVIASIRDLYGLVYLTNTEGETFSGKTVYMVSDIEVNEDADAEAWANGDATLPSSWAPIAKYSGAFNGCGNSISGLYAKDQIKIDSTTIKGVGLFTEANGATITDLNVINSYLVLNTTNGTGGVVGRGSGMFQRIYTDVIIEDINSNPRGYAGGIIGATSGDVKISDCWSACVIDTANQKIGGIIGEAKAEGYCTTISNCLFTGELTHHYSTSTNYYKTACYMGGIIGYAQYTLTISDCIASGIVQCLDSEEAKTTVSLTNVNLDIGSATKSSTTVSDCYALSNSDSDGSVLGYSTSYYDFSEEISADDVKENNTVLGLDYVTSDNPDGFWTVREGNIPMLTTFLQWSQEIETE